MSQLLLLLWMFFVVWNANCDTSPYYSFSTNPPDHHNPDVEMTHDTKTRSYDLTGSKDFSMQNPIQRFQRNAPTDNIQQLLEKSSILARIANGISLQAGIMGNSIQEYKAISELLNFGDVYYFNISSFKATHMNTLVEKLKGLPTAVDDSIKKLEDSTLAWDRRRKESETIKSGLDDDKMKSYFDDLKKLDSTFDFDPIMLVDEKVKVLVKTLEDIENLKSITTVAEKKTAAYKFSLLTSNFDEALNELKNLSSAQTEISNYKELMESETIFASVRTAINSIIDRQKLEDVSDSASISQFKKNFQRVDDLKISFEQCNDDFILLSELAKNRLSDLREDKKHTGGFINGISDVEQLVSDISGAWIDEITAKNVPLEKLAISLQPLFNLSSNIYDIDNRLKPAITSGSSQSINYLNELRKTVLTTPNDSQSLADFLKVIDECTSKTKHISRYQLSQEAIEKINSVGNIIVALRESLDKVNPDQQQNDFNDFIDFLGFKNIEDNLNSKEEVAGVMEKIKKSDDFEKFKNKITDIANGFNIENLNEFKHNISDILSAKDKIKFDGLTEELSAYECLRSHKEKMEKIATAIEITQTLRDVKVAEVENVEKWSNAVSSVSQDLHELVGKANRMKISPSLETSQINSVPFSPETKDTIITSVNSLRSALELKQMKISFPDLESIRSVVKNEINAITNSTEKKEVKDGWGNHTEDVSNLKTMVTKIEDFDKNLNLTGIKTMEGYGKQISQLENLPSVNINLKNKLEALNYLISKSTNPNVNLELQKSKEIFEKIDSLDLDFASKKSIFNGASAAFKDFNNFLIGLSTALQIPPSSVQKPAPMNSYPEEEATKAPDYLMIFGVGGGSLAGAVFIGVATWIIYKLIKRWLLKKSLRIWIKNQIFETKEEARKCHEGYLAEIQRHNPVKKNKVTDYVPEAKRRSKNLFCNPETALKQFRLNGNEMRIHANLITAEDGQRFFATQLPILDRKKEAYQQDTCEEFWHMCMRGNVKNIIAVCSARDMDCHYFERHCDLKTFGRYDVRPQKDYLWDGNVRVRRIRVTDNQCCIRRRMFRVFCLDGWEESKMPDKKAWQGDVQWILKKATKWKRPVVVHSNLGIGRAMSVIGVYTISEAVKRNSKTNLTDELSKLRAARWESIQNFHQTYWIQLTVCMKLNDEYKLGLLKDCEAMYKMFEEVLADGIGSPDNLADKKQDQVVIHKKVEFQIGSQKELNLEQHPVIANSIKTNLNKPFVAADSIKVYRKNEEAPIGSQVD